MVNSDKSKVQVLVDTFREKSRTGNRFLYESVLFEEAQNAHFLSTYSQVANKSSFSEL